MSANIFVPALLVKSFCICYIADMKTQPDLIQQAFERRAALIVSLHQRKWTLREIGERVGLTYERVRQILRDNKKVAK